MVPHCRYKTRGAAHGGGGEVRQLPHQAPEHLHGERGGGRQVCVRGRQVWPPQPLSSSHAHIDSTLSNKSGQRSPVFF